MAEVTGGEGGGRNTMIIAVVAILIVAVIAIWATQRKPAEKPAGTSASATVGDKNADVNLKIDLPDSVTIDAH